MKQIAILFLMTIICFSPFQAQAGSARRHTLEGVVIGAGITLVGTALVHGMSRDREPACERAPVYSRHREPGFGQPHGPYAKRGPRGRWEIQKIWISDEYENRWNPGHYNRRGHWVSGRHESFLVTPGHWQKQKVWVSRKYKH